MRSCGLLLVVLALAVAGGFGRVARAQELSLPHGEPNLVQSVPVGPPTGWKASEEIPSCRRAGCCGKSERVRAGSSPSGCKHQDQAKTPTTRPLADRVLKHLHRGVGARYQA